MKPTIACLIIAFSSCFPGLAEPTLREAIDRQIAMFEKSQKDRKPVVYPELAQRIERIFLRYPATHIVISGFSDGARKPPTDIYIRGEEIYVSEGTDGWNLVANREGVFEWEKGHKTGIKIKRNDDDLVAYIYYLTDPSSIMASLYYVYLTRPDQFAVISNNDKKWTELRLKEPQYGLEAIYVSEKPLWFYGMRIGRPEGSGWQEIVVSAPEQMRGLPERFMQEFKQVTFENSDLTLKRHITFL